jgi:hypothetical protein
LNVNRRNFEKALEIARMGSEEPAFSEECRDMFREIVAELWLASGKFLREITSDDWPEEGNT